MAMDDDNRYIRFDWAVKRMLRDKANFGVLEGLITVLLGETVHIEELLESEGNQEEADDKFNRVDIKAKNSKGDIIIVEIQLTRELHYLQRVLYGVSKAITEHIRLGQRYDHVKKVYSISILYFDLGQGADYLYHGSTRFVGVHTHDTLRITDRDKSAIGLRAPEDFFPEYYLIRVNEFNKVAKTPLEEWLDYIKNGVIRDDTRAPGLQEAKRKLQYMKMGKAERQAYDRHIDAIMTQNDVLYTYRLEGLEQGREEGRKQGIEEGRAEGLEQGREEGRAEGLEQGREQGRVEERRSNARAMKQLGLSAADIHRITGLPEDEIERL